MNKFLKAAGLSLAVLSSSMMATAANAAQNVGYINTAQVFQTLPQREVVLQKMQEDFKDKAAEIQKIQANAQQKIEKLQRDGELLGPEEVEKLRIEIGELDSKYKVKAQAFEKARARREAEEQQKLFALIQDAVKKVAEREGYDMIVDTQAMQYGKPEDNISELVIKELK